MIQFKENDRFFDSEEAAFENGDIELDAKDIELLANYRYQLHEVVENERLDTIAYKYYKESDSDASKLWWLIAFANDIDTGWDLTDLVGTQIKIPNLAQYLLSR